MSTVTNYIQTLERIRLRSEGDERQHRKPGEPGQTMEDINQMATLATEQRDGPTHGGWHHVGYCVGQPNGGDDAATKGRRGLEQQEERRLGEERQ